MIIFHRKINFSSMDLRSLSFSSKTLSVIVFNTLLKYTSPFQCSTVQILLFSTRIESPDAFPILTPPCPLESLHSSLLGCYMLGLLSGYSLRQDLYVIPNSWCFQLYLFVFWKEILLLKCLNEEVEHVCCTDEIIQISIKKN